MILTRQANIVDAVPDSGFFRSRYSGSNYCATIIHITLHFSILDLAGRETEKRSRRRDGGVRSGSKQAALVICDVDIGFAIFQAQR
jgi:hypothetical protein